MYTKNNIEITLSVEMADSKKNELQIDYSDLSHRVYEKIKLMILSDQLKPGDKILQEDLARQLGVSRTPLLKALNILEHELLVESIPRRGMFVKTMSLQEIHDAFICRNALEGHAAGIAATKISDVQVQELKDLFNPFYDKFKQHETIDKYEYRLADLKFHDKIIEISDNKILKRLELFNNIFIITYHLGLIRSPEETLAEHFAIIDALEGRDEEMAKEKMSYHIKKSSDKIQKIIDGDKQ